MNDIASLLIDNFEEKIKNYFSNKTPDKWKNDFGKQLEDEAITHDEPWLTLIACYSVFGNQENFSSNRINAINEIISKSGVINCFKFDSLESESVKVEVVLPEILTYRDNLKQIFLKENFHLYPDIKQKIEEKKIKEKASFEGSTNLDLMITGKSNETKIVCFIEAKFLSDISYQIRYNPVRDQIIRNIDAGINQYVNEEKNDLDSIKNFYFFMLTPKIFRPAKFGEGKNSELNLFGANSSRLYCYKMLEYLDWEKIKQNLPHRKFDDEIWKTISNNIGWLTFEDFYTSSQTYNTVEDIEESKMIDDFFRERNLMPT